MGIYRMCDEANYDTPKTDGMGIAIMKRKGKCKLCGKPLLKGEKVWRFEYHSIENWYIFVSFSFCLSHSLKHFPCEVGMGIDHQHFTFGDMRPIKSCELFEILKENNLIESDT